jgi:lipopolysaccharide transport system ATP-binding protein
MEADGAPADVLDRYQKVIMDREAAYAEGQLAMRGEQIVPSSEALETATPQFTYRHGNGDAEIVNVELLNGVQRPVKLVETGEPVHLRVRAVFHQEVDDPVYGFIIRNRHGIYLYGTNTRVQGLRGGRVKRGDTFETTFSFNCWLAPDLYSVSVAVHSPAAVSFDWMDGALFFRVFSDVAIEGVANLNATITTQQCGLLETTIS